MLYASTLTIWLSLSSPFDSSIFVFWLTLSSPASALRVDARPWYAEKASFPPSDPLSVYALSMFWYENLYYSSISFLSGINKVKIWFAVSGTASFFYILLMISSEPYLAKMLQSSCNFSNSLVSESTTVCSSSLSISSERIWAVNTGIDGIISAVRLIGKLKPFAYSIICFFRLSFD